MFEQVLVQQVKAVEWRDGALHVLDQRALPAQQVWLSCQSVPEVAEAIEQALIFSDDWLAVAAGYGLLLAAQQRCEQGAGWQEAWFDDGEVLLAAQPEAAKLAWAVQQMRDCFARVIAGHDLLDELESQVQSIERSVFGVYSVIAQLGLQVLRSHQPAEQSLLLHGHVSSLAGGAAVAMVMAAHEAGLIEQVYLQASDNEHAPTRLSAWELAQQSIPQSHFSAAAAAQLLKVGGITWVVVVAECIAANGDLVNTIGTYQLAVNAMHHGVRFMVVAPSAVIDLNLAQADDLSLEALSDPQQQVLAEQCLSVEVGSFDLQWDVTPADFIDLLVTEKGVIERPDAQKIAQLLCRKRLH